MSLVSFEEFQGYRQRRHNRALDGRQSPNDMGDHGEPDKSEEHVAGVADCAPADGPIGQSMAKAAATIDTK